MNAHGSLIARSRGAIAARAVDWQNRHRVPPELRIDTSQAAPTVYYLTPHFDHPSGGVRVLYRHVDTLNAMGIDAAVLHAREGFRCTWFENETRVVYPQSLVLHPDDVVVVPEYYAYGFDRLPRGVRTVVFNQNAYQTFDAVPIDDGRASPYRMIADLTAIMTVSHDNAALLELTFPDVPIWRCRPVVDGALFHPGAGAPRRRAIAYVDSRRRRELGQLVHTLRAIGVDWEVVRIAGMPEREVATLLRQVALFVSLSEREGFGLPPAEAMASGCYVVGYTGGGGDEFFDPTYCTPVTSQLDLVRAVVRATQLPLDELARLGLIASTSVLGRYDDAGLRADLAATIGSLVA